MRVPRRRVVPLTSTLRPSPTHVDLPAGEGGLDRPSMANCEQATTLD
jgi:mRNA-degrading endonuclease toxin of MazEF toxin-antitoxin module